MEPIEYLNDFRFRCHDVVIRNGDTETMKEAVRNGKCPFIECFEKDAEFRRMRKYYRASIHNGLKNDLIKVIEEVEDELRR